MRVSMRLVLFALGALLVPHFAAAQDGEVELSVRNRTSDAMTVFALWDSGTRIRLGDLNANRSGNYDIPVRGQEVTLLVQTTEVRVGERSERLGGDNPSDFAAVRGGSRVEWEIRRIDPLDLFYRTSGGSLAGDFEEREPRVSRYTAISALRIEEAQSEEDEARQTQAYLEALQAINEGIEEEDDNPEAYLHLGIVQVGLKDYPAAADAFDYAEALYPDYADEDGGTSGYRFNGWIQAYNDATIKLEENDTEGAIEFFRLANRLFDERPEAFLNLGAQLANRGDLDGSIAAWQDAIAVIENPDIDPDDDATRESWDTEFWPMAHNNLGQILASAGRSEEAIPLYEKLLGRDPDNAQARSSLAMAMAQTGQGDGGLSVFDEILGREDGSPLDYFNAGVSLYTVDQLDQAAIGFQKSVERAPMYRDALQNLAQTLNALEDYEAQVPYSERLLELDPYNEYGYQMHIRALVEIGRQSDGVAVLDVMRELPFVTDNLQLQPSNSGAAISGQAINKTLPPGTTITLRFTFYDANGVPIGTEDTEVTLSDPEVAHAFQVSFAAEMQVLGYGYEFLN